MKHIDSKNKEAWQNLFSLMVIFMIVFIGISLFVPNKPILSLHWICEMVPFSRHAASQSTFQYVTCTMFSIVWLVVPILFIFYFRWFRITKEAIKLSQERKIVSTLSFGVGLPCFVWVLIFGTPASEVGYSGRINHLLAESRLFLGIFCTAITISIPFFAAISLKWFSCIPRIYFHRSD